MEETSWAWAGFPDGFPANAAPNDAVVSSDSPATAFRRRAQSDARLPDSWTTCAKDAECYAGAPACTGRIPAPHKRRFEWFMNVPSAWDASEMMKCGT